GRTSGSTCAARSGPASFAATCWSGSCAACSLRKPASPRCGHLRVPFSPRCRTDAVTRENPGPRREAERRIALWALRRLKGFRPHADHNPSIVRPGSETELFGDDRALNLGGAAVDGRDHRRAHETLHVVLGGVAVAAH